jgi:hypothetical protein
MFKWLFELLYGSTPAEFRSSFGVSDSIERLRTATKRSVFSAIGEQAAVGKVSEERVRLQRVIPMVGNSFKPFFVGRFERRDGVTVLSGRFSMLLFTKVFMTFWLGAVLLSALVFPVLGVRAQKGSSGFAVFMPIFMLAAGVGLIALGKWFARNDVAWLSKVIEGALSGPGRGAVLGAPSTDVPETQPALVLKVAAAVLAVGGTMALVSLAALPPAAAPHGLPRQWVQACAVLQLLLAIGIWMRSRWAWWGVFGLLAFGAAASVWSMNADSGDAVPTLAKALFGFFSLIVVAVWGRWWYAQRKHFV